MITSKTIAGLIGPTLVAIAAGMLLNIDSLPTLAYRHGKQTSVDVNHSRISDDDRRDRRWIPFRFSKSNIMERPVVRFASRAIALSFIADDTCRDAYALQFHVRIGRDRLTSVDENSDRYSARSRNRTGVHSDSWRPIAPVLSPRHALTKMKGSHEIAGNSVPQ
jgi:hypothetical protein